MNKKFSLTATTRSLSGITLFQIKAEMSFGSVSKGDLGGYVEKEANLSADGYAWIFGNAAVFGYARISGDAEVSGDAWIFGDAAVSGNARIFGHAWISGDAAVSGDAEVSGNARVSAKASFTKGRFVGGDDSGKITDITEKTGSTYWKNQYVLGDYEITPIEDEITPIEDEKAEPSLSGRELSVTIDNKTYTAIIK